MPIDPAKKRKRRPTAAAGALKPAEANGRFEVAQNVNIAHAPARSLPWLSADAVKHTAVDWLLPGLIPRGRLTAVVGESNVGKSTMYAAILAAHTRGCAHSTFGAGAAAYPPGRAVYYSPEGAQSEECIGRLAAAGADLSRVCLGDYGADGRRSAALSLPDRMAVAEREWRDNKVSLVILDPILSYVSPGVSPLDSGGVRALLEGLEAVAEGGGITILFTAHYRKNRSGPPLDWIAGAAAWSQVPRYVIALGRDPENESRRVVVAAKAAATRECESRLYQIEDVEGFGLWKLGKQSRTTAEDLGRAVDGETERDALKDARAFLMDSLEGGEQRARDIVRTAREVGISERTLRRAKVALAVTSRHEGRPPDRHMVWSRPQTWPS